MNIKIPKDFRKGQTIFDFLEWLKVEKGMEGNQNYRLADTFHISDKEFDVYLKEYNSLHLSKQEYFDKINKEHLNEK